MNKFTNKLAATALLCLISLAGWAQADGDFRTVATGNWSAAGTWERYNLSITTWEAAGVGANNPGQTPGSTASVFIEDVQTVTVDVNAGVVNLNLGGTTNTRLVINAGIVLEVSGILRNYTGSAPGNDNSNPPANFISTGSGGKLRFIGLTRNITSNNQWGTNPRNYNVEFALTATNIGTFVTGFKCGDIVIASGIMVCNSDLRVERASGSNTGTIIVQNGAVLRMGTGSIQRVGTAGSTAHIGSLTVDAGGTLEFTNTTVGLIGAAAINFNGKISYTSTSAQTLVTKGANSNGVDPNTYTDLTLQSSAKTLSQHTTVNGILEMRTSSGNTPSLALNTFALTYGPSAILQYRGIGTPVPAQTTASTEWPDEGSASSIPPNVDFFNQAGVTLNANKAITGNLKLSAAVGINNKITLGNFNLKAASVNIPSNDGNKFFVTNGTGSLRINNINATAVLFPIGNSTYNPVTIANGGGLNWSARVEDAVNNVQSPYNTSQAINRTWHVSPSAAVSSAPDVTFGFDDSQAGQLADATAYNNEPTRNVQVWHYDGNFWTSATSSIALTPAAGVQAVTMSGNTRFSPFAISKTTSPLPVTLTGLSGQRTRSGIALQWATASEQNNLGFEVQRSVNGSQYETIGFVNSQAITGNSSSELRYSYTDAQAGKGKYFYRLKQVDIDQRSRMSNVLVISATDGVSLAIEKIMRNGSQAILQVYAPEKQTIQLSFTNAAGRLVHRETRMLEAGTNSLPVDISRLQQGVHFVTISSNKEAVTGRFIQ